MVGTAPSTMPRRPPNAADRWPRTTCSTVSGVTVSLDSRETAAPAVPPLTSVVGSLHSAPTGRSLGAQVEDHGLLTVVR